MKSPNITDRDRWAMFLALVQGRLYADENLTRPISVYLRTSAMSERFGERQKLNARSDRQLRDLIDAEPRRKLGRVVRVETAIFKLQIPDGRQGGWCRDCGSAGICFRQFWGIGLCSSSAGWTEQYCSSQREQKKRFMRGYLQRMKNERMQRNGR